MKVSDALAACNHNLHDEACAAYPEKPLCLQLSVLFTVPERGKCPSCLIADRYTLLCAAGMAESASMNSKGARQSCIANVLIEQAR